jgi:Rrf2 family protein
MKQNSKLSLALHTLGHMGRAPDVVVTSDQIAEHHHTNPVVVRRVLGLLRDQGIVRSDKGHSGGWRLAKGADQITVAEIYRAIGEPFLNPRPLADLPDTCAIVTALQSVVRHAMAEAETVLLHHLSGRTIADLSAAIDAAPGAPKIPAFPARESPL